MRILLLCHAFNSLSQRLFVELQQDGHEVSVEFDINDAVTAEAVELFRPDLVIAPFLKRAIPESVWRRHVCLVVHPGIVGDRGPAALDWAILEGEPDWGVTVLQATGELDAGPVWSAVEFPMRAASKASLYRHEVTEAAVAALRLALARVSAGRLPTAAARPVGDKAARTAASAAAAGGSRHRLAAGHDAGGAAQDPRRRRLPRRARHAGRARGVSLRRPCRGRPARDAGDTARPLWPGRMPRDPRRRGVDRPPARSG